MSPQPDADDALNLTSIEERWQSSWQERRLHEAHPEEGGDSFFVTYPYSYMNAFAHVGHAYTMLRADMMARYQRMQGKNVLFPFAYHVTGTPIVAAANRIREGEETQIQQLKDQGIPEQDVEDFSDPMKWIDYFPEQWRQDVDRLGLMIDWRRQFHTTEINPYYDAFIRWQFRALKEQGLVRRGEHPVVWDPEAESVLSDHDRMEGEGATPQEYTLIKLQDADDPDRLFVAATLRPETMFGQTNAWVNPDETYTEIEMGRERWVVAQKAAHKFEHQYDEATLTDRAIRGEDLVGAHVLAPARDREILVLPASFVGADTGTGVVTSVPSDAPYDHQALQDLKDDPEQVERYGLDPDEVRSIEPVPIIDTPELGDLPAPSLCQELGIDSQKNEQALEEATDEVYRRGFYEGTMKEGLEEVGGLPVQEAKDVMKGWLVEQGGAAIFYDLTEPVVARSLTRAVVKVVDDQWFMAYGDEAWKSKVKEALDDTVRLYPEKVRSQFDHVVGWLNDWACTRATGLGTKLPWDEQWIIESLSDSTVYMAYYTIAHLLEDEGVDAEDVQDNDVLFSYVFQGDGDPGEAARGTLTKELVERMREEFTHWYPVDFRNSGKDLVQNHLTFMVYNHVALFGQEHWPRGISVNGWVTIGGEKMSKSQGNFVTLREALEDHGATATRLTLANAGEGLDDANFDPTFAESIPGRLNAWYDTVTTPPDDARKGPREDPDVWFYARLSEIVEEARRAYEDAMFRSALKASFFETTRAWNRYTRRCLGKPHLEAWERFASVAIRLMTPIIPHLASEAWLQMGSEGDVIDATFPRVEDPADAKEALAGERLVERVLEDTRGIVQATGEDPSLVRVFTAPGWKRVIVEEALRLKEKGDLDPGTLTGRVMQEDEIKQHGPSAARFAKEKAISLDRGETPDLVEDERRVIAEASAYLEAQIGCPVEVHEAGQANDVEHGGKADRAEPGRPGIYLEP